VRKYCWVNFNHFNVAINKCEACKKPVISS
jgi:hypothetical protein